MLCTGAASVNNLSGPVGIVKNMGDTYEQAVSMSGVWLGILNMLNWGSADFCKPRCDEPAATAGT